MNINILLSTIPISTKTIGSWNIMYAKLAKEKPKLLSHIIAPKSDDDFINTEYLPVNLLYSKYFSINKYLYNHNYLKYYNRIKKILNSTNEVIIVNIIDDVKLLINLHLILVRNGIRNRVRIIFHLHGYDIYLQGNKAYDCMDTLLVLTMAAYRFQINKRSDISCKVKQFYNGVDQNKFHIATTKKQQEIKNSLGLEEDKVYYLWLSQDRKKKGLHIILEAWKVFIEDKSNVELLIIGTKKYDEIDQVTYLGKIANELLPPYYQISTFYLFPTLFHEGHPLALTEALKSGCYCLVSDIEPLPEIMKYGEYGVMVDFPNNPSSWLKVMNKTYVSYNYEGNPFMLPSEVYNFDTWMCNMERVMEEELI